jgi:hypothetical protein
MEKTMKITWEGKPVELVVKEITWREKTNCIKKSIKEVQRGRQLKKEVDHIYQKELMILAAISSPTMEIPPDFFDKISGKDGERLYQVFSELNDLDNEEGEE